MVAWWSGTSRMRSSRWATRDGRLRAPVDRRPLRAREPVVCGSEVESGQRLPCLLHGQAPLWRPPLPTTGLRRGELELAGRLIGAASWRVEGASAAAVASVA